MRRNRIRIVEMLRESPPSLAQEYETEWEEVRDALRDVGCDEETTELLVQEMRYDEEWCPCCGENDFWNWADDYLEWWKR